MLDPRHAARLRLVVALERSAKDRTCRDRPVKHPRQPDIDAVGRLADKLLRGVEPLQRLAGNLPILRGLERHIRRRRQLGGGARHLTVADRAAGRPVMMTPLAALHSEAGTFHALAAAWINIMRAAAPALRTYSFDSRIARLPVVLDSPHTRSRAKFSPGVGNSVVYRARHRHCRICR